jgi:hypothetical protein
LIVRESISFERTNDPIKNINIGKNHLIKIWLDEIEIKNYIINLNYTIDVEGDVNLYDKNLIQFPNYIQFNKIYGKFVCGPQ